MNNYVNTKRVPHTLLEIYLKIPELYNSYERFKNDPVEKNMKDLITSAENLEKSIEVFKQTMALSIEEISSGEEINKVIILSEKDQKGLKI